MWAASGAGILNNVNNCKAKQPLLFLTGCDELPVHFLTGLQIKFRVYIRILSKMHAFVFLQSLEIIIINNNPIWIPQRGNKTNEGLAFANTMY